MARRAKGEGTIRKRKDGRWEGWFNIGKDENGKVKRISVTAKTKTECQDKLKTAQEKYREEQSILSTHNYLTDSDPTLETWYGIWLDSFCKGVIKDYTIRGYESRFKMYILPAFGKMKLSEISTVACQQFLVNTLNNGRIKDREKKGPALSLSTVTGIRRTLNSCLQKAVDEGILIKNPCSKVKLPAGSKPEMKTMKKEELGAFMEEAKRSGCYEFYYLELSTGLRLGEICALEWSDLDVKNKTISVKRSAQKIKGEIVISTPKTKSSIRTIRINDDLVDLLLAMKERQIESKYIFPSPETGGVRDLPAVTRKLHRIQERAGVQQIRFHDLRHTFATLTLEAGVDVKTVSHMLGHTDAGFTMNTYMHVTDDMQKKAADKMKTLIENSNKSGEVIEFPA